MIEVKGCFYLKSTFGASVLWSIFIQDSKSLKTENINVMIQWMCV